MNQPVPRFEELRRIFAGLGFITTSQEMCPVLQRAYKAARVSDATVLLQGETGTGKQVLARAIHSLDGKRSRCRNPDDDAEFRRQGRQPRSGPEERRLGRTGQPEHAKTGGAAGNGSSPYLPMLM